MHTPCYNAATMDNNPPTLPLTIDQVAARACDVLLQDGTHVATVIAQDTENIVMASVPSMPNTPSERVQMMRTAGATLAQSGRLRSLQEVFFIFEAWMSTATDDAPPVTPPSEDPRRIETLIVTALKVGANQPDMRVFEMIRDGDELVEIRPYSMSETTSDNPLLAAFFEGFHLG